MKKNMVKDSASVYLAKLIVIEATAMSAFLSISSRTIPFHSLKGIVTNFSKLYSRFSEYLKKVSCKMVLYGAVVYFTACLILIVATAPPTAGVYIRHSVK